MTDTDHVKCIFYLSINEEGEFDIDKDEGDCASLVAENYGGSCTRTIRLTVKIRRPQVTDVTTDVPDDAGTTSVIDVEAE